MGPGWKVYRGVRSGSGVGGVKVLGVWVEDVAGLYFLNASVEAVAPRRRRPIEKETLQVEATCRHDPKAPWGYSAIALGPRDGDTSSA